ncbi:F-box family protein [Striga asiatica]|uniref:F-box family protein n=1 Tax=Striga asiatica TaxID=4170 RepID=A0A5A7RH22_STRAF|nr:F-box family protein [Striga asiatica]
MDLCTKLTMKFTGCGIKSRNMDWTAAAETAYQSQLHLQCLALLQPRARTRRGRDKQRSYGRYAYSYKRVELNSNLKCSSWVKGTARKKSTSPIDRLSSLPDDVIYKTLSFFPAIDSITTSVLARRWRNLWAHVPVLYFSEIDLVNDALNQICAITSLVDLSLDLCLDTKLSQIIFSCKTLVDLSLGLCYIPDSGDVSLPALRNLKLEIVSYESYKSLPNLLFGCPVLEELEIETGWDLLRGMCWSLWVSFVGFMNITISEFSVLNVKFPNLTKLVLEEAYEGFVTVFLENADNLEVLPITLLYQFEEEDLNYWVEPKQVPTCLISHLKYVAMYGFEGVEPELDMTKYLLMNSKVLKSFKIKPRSQQPRLKGNLYLDVYAHI